MKKLSMRNFIIVFGISMILIYYVITNYDFFPVIRKASSPLIIGFVIAYLLEPLVKWVQKLSKNKINRGFSILISLLVVLGMVTIFGAILVPSIVSSVSDIIEKISNLVSGGFNISYLERLLNGIDSELFSEVVDYVNNSLQDILVKVGELSTFILNAALVTLSTASSGVFNFIMALVIGIYMLAGKDDLLRRIRRLNYALNERKTADTLLRIVHKSDEIFSSFFVGKIIDSAIVGVLCFILMWLFRIPNAPAIGFIVGLTNIIPYFGPFIGAVPAVLVTIASGSIWQVLIVLALIVAIQQFDGIVLGPKILGDKVGVGAFWIIVSVSIGGSLFGVIGMFLGVPVVVLLKTLTEEFVEKRLEEKKLDI